MICLQRISLNAYIHDEMMMMMPNVNVTQNKRVYALDSVANLHPYLCRVLYSFAKHALREFAEYAMRLLFVKLLYGAAQSQSSRN